MEHKSNGLPGPPSIRGRRFTKQTANHHEDSYSLDVDSSKAPQKRQDGICTATPRHCRDRRAPPRMEHNHDESFLAGFLQGAAADTARDMSTSIHGGKLGGNSQAAKGGEGHRVVQWARPLGMGGPNRQVLLGRRRDDSSGQRRRSAGEYLLIYQG